MISLGIEFCHDATHYTTAITGNGLFKEMSTNIQLAVAILLGD